MEHHAFAWCGRCERSGEVDVLGNADEFGRRLAVSCSQGHQFVIAVADLGGFVYGAERLAVAEAEAIVRGVG